MTQKSRAGRLPKDVIQGEAAIQHLPGVSCTQWVLPSHPVVEGTLSPILQMRKPRLRFLKEFLKDKAGKWLEFSGCISFYGGQLSLSTRQEDIFLTPSDNRNS